MKNFFKVQRKFKGGFKVRTLKVKSISVMLIFSMMLAMFMPITASARTILSVDETGDMHLWITTDGFLHWDAVAGATNYRIDIYQQPSTGITPEKTVNLDSSNLYYNLYGAMDVEGFESRDYRIEVHTTGGGNPHENLVFYYDSPLEKLNAPIDLTWVGNEAHWDAVPNAEYYDVYLRKTTTTGGVVMKSHVTGTSVDLSEYSPENGWYFKVIAYADGYRASAIVESPRKGGGTRTILPVEETGDMHLWITTDGFLRWDAVAGATNYRIDIYQQPSTGITPAKTVNLDSSNLYYNLYGAMDVEGFESREYRIEVYTTGGGNPHENLVFYYDSPLEKLNAPIDLTWVGNEAHWDAVPNAEYYDVYLRKTTTTGGVVMKSHVTGTSVDLSEYSPENGWYFKVIAYADGYRASAIVESPRKGDSSVATSYHVGADVYNITTNEQYTGGKVKIVTPDDTGDYAYVGYGYDVDANAEVTMYAQADTGYEFVEWRTGSESGTQYSTNATVTFNATEDKVLYAIFQQTVSLTQISELSATVTAPVGGEHPSFTATVPDGAHYTAVVDTWYDLDNNGAHLTNSDTFVTDNEYQARIHFTANTGYEIANGASYTINGTPNYSTFDTVKQRGMIFVATAPAVTTYTVTYDANGGSGTMVGNMVEENSKFTLENCTYIAPDGKQFKAWAIGSVNGEQKQPGEQITITAETYIYAIWKKRPVTNPFTDVSPSSYYYKAVLWAVENNITTGTSATTFSPSMVCDRGQVVTFLWRVAGSPEPQSLENPFSDVKRTSYYYKAVLWAVEQGITKGTGNGKFNPSMQCDRGQIVTFLYRFKGKPQVTSSNPFSDVKKTDYYYKAVLWAVKEGITKGTGGNKFSPLMKCDRGQIVTFLYRACN